MEYKIIGNVVPAVELTLNKGDSMYTQAGSMAWRTPNISLETSSKGGILGGLGRMVSGESFFMNTYTSLNDGEKIAFAAHVPGKIVELKLDGSNGYTIQKGAFLCATPGVECKVALNKKLSTGFFGGEGFVLQSLSGEGTTFIEIDGDSQEIVLNPGETMYVDTGNVVAFDSTVTYDVEMIKGAKNIFFGGEGLFLTKLVGPGKIILQTFNFNDLTQRIISKIPNKGSN